MDDRASAQEFHNPLLAAALTYVKRGWSVLPLHPNDKTPLGRLVHHGFHDASIDQETIVRWWTMEPTANVGIRTGSLAGFVILDVDPRAGGDTELFALEQEHGKLPETVEVLTGGGGRHLYFIHPGGTIKNLTLKPGLELKADGGYVVAPPSGHPSGGSYVWECASHPDDVPVAPLPEWLLDHLLSGKKKATQAGPISSRIPEGQRSDTLASLAGTMRRRGMGPESIAAALLIENEQRCDPPLYEKEVLKIAASIARYATACPPKPYQSETAFPIDAMPIAFQSYCRELADALPCPLDLVAPMVLGIASAAIGRTRLIRLKQGWCEPAGLYIAIVAPPGCLKSPVLREVSEPIRAQQERWRLEHEKAKSRFDEQLLAYQRACTAYTKGQGQAPGKKPDRPIMRRIWTGDITVERLGVILAENPRGILLGRDELSAWIRGLNQYKQGRGADRQFYLSAWSQASTTIDRQQKDPIFLDRPSLSILGCIPPEILSDLSEDGGREDGLVHRILFAYPEPCPVVWKEEIVSESTTALFRQRISSLLALNFTDDGQPRTMDLTPEARQRFVQWHDEHCAEAEAAELHPSLRGFWAKLKGYCARLALVHQLCTNPQTAVIGVEAISAGCDLTHYFKMQVRKVVPLLVKQRLSPQERCEREIRRNLSKWTALTKRALQRLSNSSAVVFNEVFESLLQTGQLKETQTPGKTGPVTSYLLSEESE